MSKKTPKRLMKASAPAINLVDELRVTTEMLKKQYEWCEFALVHTSSGKDVQDVNDEFLREYNFSEQAKEAAIEMLPKIAEMGIPTEMPATYKGDMVKDERQMAKIRDTLKSKKDSIETSEKMKKLRELKKMGKKIQEEVKRKRSKDKKEFLEQVKKRPVSEIFDD